MADKIVLEIVPLLELTDGYCSENEDETPVNQRS